MVAVVPPLVGDLGRGDCYAVQSSTNPERAYLVVRFYGTPADAWSGWNQWRCNCPAGIRDVACRHIEAVKTHIAEPEPPRPVRRHLSTIKGGAA